MKTEKEEICVKKMLKEIENNPNWFSDHCINPKLNPKYKYHIDESESGNKFEDTLKILKEKRPDLYDKIIYERDYNNHDIMYFGIKTK